MKKLITVVLVSTFCSACTVEKLYDNSLTKDADVTQTTRAGALLAALPDPTQQIPVVVYEFQDQTGQFKSNDNFVEYSSAVTKGGLAVLVKSLLDTSNGNFFLVAERGGLNNLLRERQIIRAMRSDYSLPDGSKLPDLNPMIYGGLILEGGIIFYDTNTITGGAAAGYFGISGSTQYRRDIVSVYLRAVEVQTGKVILAVNSSKTLFSYGISGSMLRYLSIDRLFEAEGGYSVNEPGQLAVRQAIETSVYSLIMEGAMKGMWSFNDQKAGQKAIADYVARRDKVTSKAPDSPKEAKALDMSPQGDAGVPAKDPKQCGNPSWLRRLFTPRPEPVTVVKEQTSSNTPVRKPLPMQSGQAPAASGSTRD